MKSTDLLAQTPGTFGAADSSFAAAQDDNEYSARDPRTGEKEAVVKADEEVRGGLLRR